MAFEVRSHNLTENDAMPDTVYQRGQDGYTKTLGVAVHSAANWRFFAAGLLLMNFINFGWNVYLSTRSSIVPYIVEVDSSSGAVISTSKVFARSVANKKEIEYFIWELVKKARTIPKDIIVYENNWNDLYTFLDGSTSQKMNDMAIRESHRDKLKNGITTMLQLKTVTPLSGKDDTYNVRWSEYRYDSDGKKLGEYELEAFFTVQQYNTDEKTAYINPLGLRIKDFSMSQVQ